MRKILTLMVFLSCAISGFTQSNNLIAAIQFDKEKEGQVTIIGIAKNLSTGEGDYSYILQLSKNEDGNSTKNKQSGNFHITNNESKTLSTISIDLSTAATFEVNLKLFDGETLLAE